MRYENRLIRYLISLVFIGVFLLLCQTSDAEINVSGWKNFGINKNDFTQNGYTAFNSTGESYDLRKDVDYIGYRGDNISDDATYGGKKIEIGAWYNLYNSTQVVVIKKMGIHNGKSLEVRIYPEYPLKFRINANSVDPLLTIMPTDINQPGNRFDITMKIFYEGTNISPVMEPGRTFLLPIKHKNGWPEYNFAMLLEKNQKVLIGNQPRDTLALIKSKTYIDNTNSKYKIGVGGAPNGIYSDYLYNALFKESIFRIGKQTVGNFSGITTHLFEPISAPSSMPKPYNDLVTKNISTEIENPSITDSLSKTFSTEISYRLPEQDNESFYPESVELVIQKNWQDYNNNNGFLYMGAPTLTINEEVIDKNEYTYSNDTHRLILSKNFLKKYAGKSVDIRTTKVSIVPGMLTSQMNDWYLGENKFEIPTSLLVESHFDTFTRIEYDEDSYGIIEMKIAYEFDQLKNEVELGKKSTDYQKEDFLNIQSAYPYDKITYEFVETEFNTLTNEETLPVLLYSDFLKTSTLVRFPIKVYENLPIVYKLKDETLINSDNEDLPHEVKRYSETPVKFKIPFTFDNYTFVSSVNKELQFGETVNNFKEATGVLNTATKKIELIYKMNKIGITVEYLLDSETGKYEKHQPIKVGTALNQNKPNIQFETEIGQKITDFIKNNKDQVNPEVPYYHNHQETGKTANYWRYSDEPVSDQNPLRPVDSEDKIPSRPITITSFYSGTASLNNVDDIDFGTHKNNLKVNEITSKKAINYSFVDTTFNKQTSLNVRFDVPIKNETNQKMTAFLLDYKGKSINQQDVPVIKSLDTEKSIFTGDLKSDLLFKRYWLGPENFGQFSGVLVWTISRDITP